MAQSSLEEIEEEKREIIQRQHEGQAREGLTETFNQASPGLTQEFNKAGKNEQQQNEPKKKRTWAEFNAEVEETEEQQRQRQRRRERSRGWGR